MSRASKRRLFEISEDKTHKDFVRKKAFDIWELGIDNEDVTIARNIGPDDVRYERAIWARAKRQDFTVIPTLLLKIKENPQYWWQAGRYLWSDELTEALAVTIAEIADCQDPDRSNLGTWIVPELMRKLEPDVGERLLLSVWPRVRHRRQFFQMAVCVGTAQMLNLAEIAIADSPDPTDLLKGFSDVAGLRSGELGKVERSEQLNVLRPYFQLFDDLELVELWSDTVRRGWHEYGRRYLLPVLRSRESDLIKRMVVGELGDISDLDRALNERKERAYFWMESQMRKGATRDELIDVLLRWLQSNMTLRGLKVAGVVAAREWSRGEFLRMRAIAEEMQGAEPLLEQIQFDVFRRTLN